MQEHSESNVLSVHDTTDVEVCWKDLSSFFLLEAFSYTSSTEWVPQWYTDTVLKPNLNLFGLSSVWFVGVVIFYFKECFVSCQTTRVHLPLYPRAARLKFCKIAPGQGKSISQ